MAGKNMSLTKTKGRMCGGKRRHPDRASAVAQMERLVRGGACADRLNVYACGHCGCWHAGHLPKPRTVR